MASSRTRRVTAAMVSRLATAKAATRLVAATDFHPGRSSAWRRWTAAADLAGEVAVAGDGDVGQQAGDLGLDGRDEGGVAGRHVDDVYAAGQARAAGGPRDCLSRGQGNVDVGHAGVLRTG